MKSRQIILSATCTLGILFAPAFAFAKLDIISLSIKPDTPSTNQDVTVSLQSYAVDLDSASITWYVDKEVIATGIAEKSIKTRTKEFGEPVIVDVVISTLDGGRFDKQLILEPMEIDMLWEADTSVPPFYKGKALPSYKSMVTVTAFPRFTLEPRDTSTFSFAWTMSAIQSLGGGLGKNSVIIPMKYAGQAVPIGVRVTDSAKEGKGGGIVTSISATEPILRFYEQAPLAGMRLDSALLQSAKTDETTFRIRAVPYFISNDDIKNENILYTWKKDSQRIDTPLNPNILPLGRNGGAAQSSSVQLLLQNKKRILQSAQASASVSFSQE